MAKKKKKGTDPLLVAGLLGFGGVILYAVVKARS